MVPRLTCAERGCVWPVAGPAQTLCGWHLRVRNRRQEFQGGSTLQR